MLSLHLSLHPCSLSPRIHDGWAGYQVYEALAVSEVLHLCEHRKIDAVVIAPDVEEPDMIEAQMRHICLKLKTHATAKDVIWELEQLFGKSNPTIQ